MTTWASASTCRTRRSSKTQEASRATSNREDQHFAEEFRERKRATCKTTTEKLRSSFRTNSGAKYPKEFPTGDVGTEQAHELAPPGWCAYKDCTNMRWQCYRRGVATKSRAWVLYGEDGACRHALAAAWDFYLLQQGLNRDACPIQGLWSTGEAAAAGGSGAAASSSSGG